MRLSKRRRSHGVLFDITPMIDVVFQLIIFFMTVSQAVTSDAEPVELPHLSGAADAGERDMVVNVNADGKLVMGGKEVSAAEVEAKARELVARRGADKLVVALRVDQKATSGAANQAVAALKRAGISRGRIAVEPVGLR